MREKPSKPMLSIEKPLVLKLKTLLSYLKYAYLKEDLAPPIIVSAALTLDEKEKLLRILRENKIVFGWLITNIEGINPSIYMHKILIKDNYKSSLEHKWRLNPNMKVAVKKEVIKWLVLRIIYPISNSQ